MTKSDFEKLSITDQDEIVMNFGTFILNYDQGATMCDIYQVFQFFVKFSYDLQRNSGPDITAFDGYDVFRLYKPVPFEFADKN